MRPDAAFNRRVMRVFEDMLEQPEDDHVSWLERVCGRLALFHEAADAIDHAHRNLIAHADIKPSNVVVEDRFGVKLLDFGIARLLDEADGEGDRHRSHTPGYASHARFEGEPATPADDVFAAGTLLGELIILNASYLVLGESYQTSDIGRSERYFSLLIGNLERLRHRGGLDWESSLTQASGYIGRGRLEAKLTDLATAAADYARAISILQDLLLTDDNNGVKWELSYVRSLLAVVDSRLGDHAAAASLSDASMAWLQRDLADAPQDPARRRALAVGLSTRADIERRTHRGAKACIVARRAVAMWTGLNAARVTPPMDLKSDGAETQALAVVASSCR